MKWQDIKDLFRKEGQSWELIIQIFDNNIYINWLSNKCYRFERDEVVNLVFQLMFYLEDELAQLIIKTVSIFYKNLLDINILEVKTEMG